MSSKTTIIKLQQNEASSNIDDNGSFEIQLQKPLTLTDQTDIMLKSCFIDTTASSSGKIQIDKDLECNIVVGKYLYNYNIDQDLKTYSDGATKPDDSIYFLCDTATHGAEINKLSTITIKPSDTHPRHWGCADSKSDTTLRFSYTNSSGKSGIPFNIIVPQQRTGGTYGTRHLEYVSRASFDPNNKELEPLDSLPVFEGNSFIYVGGAEVLKHNNISGNIEITRTNITAGSTVGTNIRPETISFEISKGQYTPSELSTTITQKLININYDNKPIGNNDGANPPTFPVNSPLLTTIQQLKNKMITGESQSTVNFCKSDGTRIFSFLGDTTGTNDRFIGTNQISLEYDEDLRKMMFSIAHFPIYVGNTDSASAGCIFGEDGVANKYSGLFFLDLNANFKGETEPVPFWDDMLGFNIGKITVSSGEGQPLNIDSQSTLSSKLNKIPLDGEQMTGALKSIDLPIQKTTNFNKVSGSIVDTTTNFTSPIYSDMVFNDPQAKSGYFLLEIDGFSNQQDFRGSIFSGNNYNANKIQGIITRYYTTESFTMDEGQGGIGLQFTGADTTITSLKVRILDHNGNIPPKGEIGDRNTIFLEVSKPREPQIKSIDDLDYSNH